MRKKENSPLAVGLLSLAVDSSRGLEVAAVLRRAVRHVVVVGVARNAVGRTKDGVDLEDDAVARLGSVHDDGGALSSAALA